DLLDFVCNDNGTLTDPSDDFYTVTVNASVVNGGASASFELFADGNSQGVFDYASGTSITLPADGRTVEIRIEDADKGCTAQQDIGPLDPCEEDCTISATVTNIICDDNGTGDDSSDDTFTFDLLVNGQNTGSGWQSVAGGLTGDYGQVITFGPYPISGGTLNFDLQDLTTTTCQTSIVVDPPMTCSACPQVLTIITPSATVSCKEQMVTLSAASTEAGNYSWTGPNGFTDDNLTTMVSDSGWYFLNATYADGCMAMDSLFVDANTNEPVAAAGPDQYLTCDIEEVLLDGSQSSSGTHIVYSWTDGNGDIVSEEINFLVRTAGTYNLQVIDTLSGCASNIDEVVIGDSTNIPTAFIYADPDNVLDCQVSSILLYSDEQANVQYFWNSVASSEVVISQPGTITLLVVDTITGCENTDQIIITDLQDYPFVNLQPIEPISCYSPSVLIDGSSSQSGPTLVYTWFDNNDNVIVGQTGDTLRVSEAGQYVLQVADTLNGCENYDTVIVESLLDNPPLAVIGQVGALDCNNATQVLDASSSTPFGNLVFSWETNLGSILSGADGPTPEIGSPGLYYLTVLDSISGCIHVDSIEILEDRVFPSIDILPSATITCRLPETTLDASGSNSPNNASIVWTSNPPGGIVSGGNTLTPLINQGGTYTLTLINQDNGCETVELVAVDEDSESPDAVASAEDDLDCITTEIALSGLGSSTGAEFVYAWSGPGVVSGRNTLEPTVNAAGLYELQVENTRNGCTDSDEVSVEENVNVPQDLDVAVTPPPCFGDLGGLEILTVSGGEGPYLYSIDNGQNFFGATEFPALDPGDYTVLVQDAIGCEYEEIFTIPEVPLKVVSVQQEIVVELGQSEQIFANTNIPNAEIDTIIWAPTDGLSCVDCLDPFVTAVDETRYSLTIIDENGCSAEAEILVRVRKERNVYIPNVFSPNGDGVNDVFMIFAGDNLIKSINSFQVFDRWGELIYEDFNFMPNDPTRGWDGRLRGELLNPAVFVYWAEVEFVDGWKELYKGDVTLLR
ncbi:MAG: gliding motility-associated C-terminal domain-containing protein, partial [Bacteroidota bacterium]